MWGGTELEKRRAYFLNYHIREHLLRHKNVIHIEKNVREMLLKTLLNNKDKKQKTH